MKPVFLIVTIVFNSVSLFGQEAFIEFFSGPEEYSSPIQAEIAMMLQDSSLVKFDHKRKVPSPIIHEIRSLTGDRFRIANPGKKCNAGCTIKYPFRPERGFIFIINCGDRWLLAYELGGWAYHHNLMYFHLKDNEVIEFACFSGKFKPFEQFKAEFDPEKRMHITFSKKHHYQFYKSF